MSEWHHFETTAELDSALAEQVANILTDAVSANGIARLVVSGGSTPIGFFHELSALPLPWSSISIMLADERWVALDHKDSNEAMVRRELLAGAAKEANFFSLSADFPDPVKNLDRVNSVMGECPAFDIVILGMGNDGHTASLFPCADELNEGVSTAAPALMVHPKTAPHARISLSKARIQNTRHGFIHIAGSDKRQILEQAVIDNDPLAAPVVNFVAGPTPFSIYWAPKN
ncbi:6-phosphogluconolactonase [Luminiphilus syltensis NOR5-1B]|uniref:6-phosphogluconolactonase n=1 Tax=Luminiphilus syltensis NOR5-1B TaxID=565045 RepID=B8KWX5_9GAMM|nr:6-phosphogluconolactonase [Luminiphilus syltensis]EED34677.1 6-phosphogluconolactonase [Luminiphilus syltensis NOR5-1B]